MLAMSSLLHKLPALLRKDLLCLGMDPEGAAGAAVSVNS